MKDRGSFYVTDMMIESRFVSMYRFSLLTGNADIGKRYYEKFGGDVESREEFWKVMERLIVQVQEKLGDQKNIASDVTLLYELHLLLDRDWEEI